MKLSHSGVYSPGLVAVISGFLFIPLLLTPQATVGEVTDLSIANTIAATLVFVYGLAVLQLMWRIEKGGAATIPFAWSYFAVQHLAFGFGGILVTYFNLGYYYVNEQGVFAYSDAALPLLRVHFVSLTAGLLAVRIARGGRMPEGLVSGWRVVSAPTSLSWRQARAVCLCSMLIHALAWLIFPRLTSAPAALYVSGLLRGPADAMFLLWGYCWRDCGSKWLLVAYGTLFALIEAIEGSRGYFLFPLVFFGVGYLISGTLPRLNAAAAIRVFPIAIFAMWIFAKSEDIRNLFSRTEVTNFSDAVQRIETIGDSSASDSVNYADGTGVPVNPLFRIGSRLFELSAADVISRTPSAVGFYGWTDEDWSVLLTGLLPLRLSSGATYFSSEGTGVFFLRSYGWYIDPYSEIRDTSTSMPATLVADSFRRFGWPGVVAWFLIFPWFLAKATYILRFRPDGYTIMLFASSLLVDFAQDYTTDITTLVDSLPRRLLLLWFYASGLSILIERGSAAKGRVEITDVRAVTASPGSRGY